MLSQLYRPDWWCIGILCAVHCIDAQAQGCSRVLKIPLAPTGHSVFVKDGNIAGIYPDLLQQISLRSGCKMEFSIVPRARLEMLFETGQADVMAASVRTSRRDQHGLFVPILYMRPVLISLRNGNPVASSLGDVIKNPVMKTSKVALVRGFDYGDAYVQWMQILQQQNRLQLEADAVSVARLIKARTVQYTLMVPYIFAGAVAQDARIADIASQVQYIPVPEIDWSDAGMYLSTVSLNENDRNHLKKALEEAARSGVVWKSFQQYYTPDVLNAGSKPR